MKNRFERTYNRYKYITGFIILLIVILIVRLFVVTVLEHEKWNKDAVGQNTKTILLPAPRGNIYDRNGVLLAGNKEIFNVTLSSNNLSNKEINNISLALITKLEENGEKVINDFPIKKNSAGKYYYTFDEEREEWLKDKGFSSNATPEHVLTHYTSEFGLDPKMNRYDKVKEITDNYHTYIPVMAKDMTFVYEKEKEEFLKEFHFSKKQIEKGVSAKECVEKLRKKLKIKKNLPDRDLFKILNVRSKIAKNQYTKYIPVTIAMDVSSKTAVYMEEIGMKGVDITIGSERYYPYGTLACHAIGYMGRISQGEAKKYVEEKGYLASDLIGTSGMEKVMEDKLHGTPGIKKIRVNSSGQYVETLENIPAKKGKDVFLTIDKDIQSKAEKSLKKALKGTKHGRSGAVVVTDVQNGKTLAMVSYPVFDPNMFADGISDKEWKSVQPENPRDSLSPAPLYNNATRASTMPGSTFKPVTALTGLKCGLNPNMQIQDRGHIMLGNTSFGCSLWNEARGTHGAEDLAKAMAFSCNYYFYCVATDKNWGTGSSLGFKEPINVEKIVKTGSSLGLGEKTGIETGEVVMPLPSKERKMKSYRVGVWNAIYNKSHQYFPKEIYSNQKKLYENISKIASWIEDNPSYDKLQKLIKENTSVKKSEIENLAGMVKFDYFNLAQWTTADIFNISIGQGDNSYTPMQMNRYISALANKGVKYDSTLLLGVEGEGKKKDIPNKNSINLTKGLWKPVVNGMVADTKRGILSNLFGPRYPIDVAAKTGTAEYQAIKQPKSEVDFIKKELPVINSKAGSHVSWSQVEKEMKSLMIKSPKDYPTKDDAVDDALINASEHKVNYDMINAGKGSYDDFGWTVSFAPAYNPKIAVTTLLIEGHSSVNAAPVCKAVMDEYFNIDKK